MSLARALPALVVAVLGPGVAGAQDLTPMERLGKLLFFDESLSANGNQSCATCHDPAAGWVGADQAINKGGAVYEASIRGRFGNRKPPSVAYATQAPVFRLVSAHDGEFVGGHFWDGRATGEKLGTPAADQAQDPFLNPAEQGLPDAASLVGKVCAGTYAALFKDVWGADACGDVEKAYDSMGKAIAAYEGSTEVNAFSSKYDAFLAGRAQLTEQERRGLELFEGKAKCANCHPSRPGPGGEPPLFTDFTYDNIGIPRNPDNPFYSNREANRKGKAWKDPGLGGVLAGTARYKVHAAKNMGRHKVPTLRNVDLRPSPETVKAYGHNGYFKDLAQVVHFYNTTGTLPTCRAYVEKPGVDCWPPPEIRENLNREEVGRLGLTPQDEAAIVAFLKTLSDGHGHAAGRR